MMVMWQLSNCLIPRLGICTAVAVTKVSVNPAKGCQYTRRNEQQFIGFTWVRSRVLRTPQIFVGSTINGLLQFAAQTYYLRDVLGIIRR